MEIAGKTTSVVSRLITYFGRCNSVTRKIIGHIITISLWRNVLTFDYIAMSFPKLHNFNEMYTPPNALDCILHYLPKDKIYWESCYWEWHLASILESKWYKVVWYKELDCLINQPKERDIWFTNPPFKWNKKFLRRAIDLWKPFIFLMRLEHLWWVEAMELLWELDFKIVIPQRRINYLTPKILRWEKTWGSPFHSIFITWWIDLPKQINYI